jgi:hypothetical protein
MTTPSPARLSKLAPAMLSLVQRFSVCCGADFHALKAEARKLEAEAYAEPKAVRVIIERDTDPTDPRKDSEPLGRIIHWHSRYSFAHDAERIDREAAEDRLLDAAVKIPIYMYDHSGVTIRTTPFGCPFDSGQVGWIYCTADDLIREKITPAQAAACMESEILVQNQYINGDVYGFRLMDEDGEEMHACWGFYGDDWKSNGIMEHLPENLRDPSKWEIKP